MKGISICILTHNVLFYNKMAVKKIRELTLAVDYEILVLDNGSTDGSSDFWKIQPDVRYYPRPDNTLKHGAALDFLVRKARMPICCALCSDAFPVSPEWIVPALHLSEKVFLAGIRRGSNRLLKEYVCPSYMFGWRNWLVAHSFLDDWPKADTGELLTQACLSEGKEISTWDANRVEVRKGLRAKACDYAGWVWHTWMAGRAQTVKNVVPVECEKDYHKHVEKWLRERYGDP